MATHPAAVLALGAGHSHVSDPALFAEVEASLVTSEQVVLLRPAEDLGAALRVLRHRCVTAEGHDWRAGGVDRLHRWLTDGRDERLATHAVTTGGQTPERTAARIAALPAAVR